MAGGDKEHKMLFDLQGGHRRNVVKVVYAVLAVLMGASLFLTVGPFSISEIFNDSGGSSDLAKPYEEEAERIEARLEKDPGNPNLLISLTRAQINAGNVEAQREANGEVILTSDSVQAYQEADQSWSEYLKATDKPNAALAALVGPMMLSLAEISTTYPQAEQRIAAATEAQKFVAEDRPSVNSLSTLAFYTYFTGDFAAAEKARAEARKLAKTEAARKEIDKTLDEYKKNASKYIAAKKQAEKAQKAAGGKAPENLENPLSPGLGSGGLGG
ncbi:MAG TPA: hypothetical protein VFN92_11755 [Solirubrobacterales bacterium]|nr:hypothetical protein [Solirubrobacterales bacterium]